MHMVLFYMDYYNLHNDYALAVVLNDMLILVVLVVKTMVWKRGFD